MKDNNQAHDEEGVITPIGTTFQDCDQPPSYLQFLSDKFGGLNMGHNEKSTLTPCKPAIVMTRTAEKQKILFNMTTPVKKNRGHANKTFVPGQWRVGPAALHCSQYSLLLICYRIDAYTSAEAEQNPGQEQHFPSDHSQPWTTRVSAQHP
jgi:hypothetical protein